MFARAPDRKGEAKSAVERAPMQQVRQLQIVFARAPERQRSPLAIAQHHATVCRCRPTAAKLRMPPMRRTQQELCKQRDWLVMKSYSKQVAEAQQPEAIVTGPSKRGQYAPQLASFPVTPRLARLSFDGLAAAVLPPGALSHPCLPLPRESGPLSGLNDPFVDESRAQHSARRRCEKKNL